MPLADPRRTVLAAASAALLLCPQSVALSAHAEATPPAPGHACCTNGASTWMQAIGPFLDQVLAEQLAFLGIPGAVIAVVHGGEILHLAGYGKAYLGGGQSVSPRDTLFRPGSVSKPATWTAVMQIVEQGRLDLHADFNRYLDRFQIPATFPEPITLAHLLTHTAGFEERGFGTYARSAKDLVPLGAFLAAQMPATPLLEPRGPPALPDRWPGRTGLPRVAPLLESAGCAILRGRFGAARLRRGLPLHSAQP